MDEARLSEIKRLHDAGDPWPAKWALPDLIAEVRRLNDRVAALEGRLNDSYGIAIPDGTS